MLLCWLLDVVFKFTPASAVSICKQIHIGRKKNGTRCQLKTSDQTRLRKATACPTHVVVRAAKSPRWGASIACGIPPLARQHSPIPTELSKASLKTQLKQNMKKLTCTGHRMLHLKNRWQGPEAWLQLHSFAAFRNERRASVGFNSLVSTNVHSWRDHPVDRGVRNWG